MSDPSDWTLLARYLSGECTADEKSGVEAWMDSDPENQLLVQQMQTVWEVPEPAREDIEVQQLWHRIATQAGLYRESRGRGIADRVRAAVGKLTSDWRFMPDTAPVLRYATLAVLVVVLPLLVTRWGGWFPWSIGAPQWATIEVSNGQRNLIALSDGSTVMLDAGTTLHYPEKFKRGPREVFMEGEGFFEVVADTRKPFVVHASDALIQVLGTKFNVRAWEPDQRVKVAVSEGQVSLRPESTSAETGVIINEGEGSVMAAKGQPSEPAKVNVAEQLSWMQNEIIFRDVALSEVLSQVERWYDLRFDLAVSAVASEHVTIHLRRHSVEDVLELISVLSGLPYTQDGRTVQLGFPEPEETELP
ncbi:FecR family protein [Candidatus Neomarinimicrobiota bacterium]